MDDFIWRSAQELCDDLKLVDVVFAREQWLPLEHLGEDASRAPYVHLHIILLPCEHDLGRSVVSRRNVACHLRVLNPGEAEVAYLQVAVLVDKDVAGFEVAMNHSRGVDIFEPPLRLSVFLMTRREVQWKFIYQDLVEEVLNELLFERS